PECGPGPETSGPDPFGRRAARSAASDRVVRVEIVLRTETPQGIPVVLPAVVYAKVLEEHAIIVTVFSASRRPT
ncbi:MAG: hypothetical protein QOE36_518, partial [Gaiellaceae bacterium]|nr:hypothetical protein [Gaiellaceae bacterium]